MKNNYFSIGDLSRLFNISIKTLRYYDEIGLLKPAKVAESSNYRYYTVEQFILVDLIKNSKLMGMPLADIKELVSSELTIDRIEQVVKDQIDQYQMQIDQMVKIQNSMKRYVNTIQNTKEIPQGQVLIHHEKARYCYSYPYQSSDVQEIEIQLRKAFLDAENSGNDVYPIFGALCSWNRYASDRIIEYLDIREYLDRAKNAKNIVVIPEGQYASIIFDESAHQKYKYYQIMTKYIEEHKLKVIGEFNEMWLVPRLNLNQQESTLLKLDIMIQPLN